MEHHVPGKALAPFYQGKRDMLGQQLLNNGQYAISKYITDGHVRFLLLNDKQVNAKEGAGNKITAFND